MAKAENTTASVKDENSPEVLYDTEWSPTPVTDNNTGLHFFKDTQANINSIVAHPNSFCWVPDFKDRDVLCWEVAEKKDIQLITIGKIKAASLRVPTKFGNYMIDLLLDAQSQEAFEQLWRSRKFGNKTGLSVPVNNLGIARFTVNLETINKDAQKNKINRVFTENDPFPGLYNGSIMNRNNTSLVSHPVADFTAGAMVAVEATVTTYNDFIPTSDKIRRFGYSLGLREVYWLKECGEDGDRDNPTTPRKKRQAEVELTSPRSFARLRKVATFDD